MRSILAQVGLALSVLFVQLAIFAGTVALIAWVVAKVLRHMGVL